METFRRDRYSIHCLDGKKCLATCVNKPPDQKGPEDLHQHARGLQAKSRSLVNSKVARTFLRSSNIHE